MISSVLLTLPFVQGELHGLMQILIISIVEFHPIMPEFKQFIFSQNFMVQSNMRKDYMIVDFINQIALAEEMKQIVLSPLNYSLNISNGKLQENHNHLQEILIQM